MAATTTATLATRALQPGTATDYAMAFKALGDPVRLQLLSRIASAAGGEICVCDIIPGLYLTAPTISHHLRTLRETGLIDGQRRGTWVYYRAVPDRIAALAALLSIPLSWPVGS
jgi:ArsR family transcriptional regulator, arsenate/arsenite/antimonite-responsive transcriptional repressor